MREIKFEYGFQGVNGIIKKVYSLATIPNIAKVCDVWNELPIVYVRQFTGLQDRNGDDIYEGMSVKHDSYGKGKIIWDTKTANFFVYFGGEAWDTNLGINKELEIINP